jgi:hypothetical protein
MEELVINLHMHTRFSDGHACHTEIAHAAIQASLDAIIITDHNIWVNGFEGYVQEGRRRVLVMIGEEIHNQARQPQKSHLMVFGAGRELSSFASDPQVLIDKVRQSDGLSFLAHPFEDSLPAFGETDIGWADWNVTGFTGLELWNGMSEFKSVVKNKIQAVFFAFYPQYIARGPLHRTLQKWDELLGTGKRVVAIGGSDAHALPMSLGPLHRVIFPYLFHFRAINTHLFIPSPLSGDSVADRRTILEALRQGHAFVGYDLPASTRGFRFTAHVKEGVFTMGDEVSARTGVTFQIRLPRKAECRLVQDGRVLKTWREREVCTHTTTQPGAYRVEVYLHYLGEQRGWIFSNPIYVRP